MPSWGELLNELQPHKNENGKDVQGLTVDELREKYLKLLSQQTGRNVIAYLRTILGGLNREKHRILISMTVISLVL